MKRYLVFPILIALMACVQGTTHAQSRRQVKVVVEFERYGHGSQKEVGSSGPAVIIEKGSARFPRTFRAEHTRSEGRQTTQIFTLVRDNAESTLTVATRVPHLQVLFYQDHATRAGYVASGVVFQEVGTSLKVRATILPGNRIKVRLTPRISYFSPGGTGTVEFTEASTEIVVPGGQPVVIGGSTAEMHEVTRQVLGFREQQSRSKTRVTLTATVQ